MNLRVVLLAAALVAVATGLVAYKVLFLGYELVPQATEDRWNVQLQLRLEGTGEMARVQMFLPPDRPEQRIYDERVLAEGMKFLIRPHQHNRVGTLTSRLSGRDTVSYRFSVHIDRDTAPLPDPEEVEAAALPDGLDPDYLEPSPLIQSDDGRVLGRLEEITAPDAGRLERVRAIYNYLADEVPTRGAEDDDALTVLQRERGSSLGKARLFAAMARAAGVPTRVVGGLDLEEGSLARLRYWSEALLAGRWVPFDAASGHLGSLPARRLVLFEGDRDLVSTEGLKGVDLRIGVLKEEVAQHRVYERKVRRSNAMLDQVSLFRLPVHNQMVMRILLLIPFGALVVAFFRNLVGVPTFGTFMPVLIALAFLETRPLMGVILLLTILLIGWTFRILLDRLQLLMIPRLSFLLTFVIFVMVGITLVAETLGLTSALSVSLFPIVILTVTIERFSIMIVEEGPRNALKATAGTVLVALACYGLLVWELLQRMALAFPELLLIVMAALLLVGRYTGYRLSEYARFAAFRRPSGVGA